MLTTFYLKCLLHSIQNCTAELKETSVKQIYKFHSIQVLFMGDVFLVLESLG